VPITSLKEQTHINPQITTSSDVCKSLFLISRFPLHFATFWLPKYFKSHLLNFCQNPETHTKLFCEEEKTARIAQRWDVQTPPLHAFENKIYYTTYQEYVQNEEYKIS
jgi:hypothetical protein